MNLFIVFSESELGKSLDQERLFKFSGGYINRVQKNVYSDEASHRSIVIKSPFEFFLVNGQASSELYAIVK